jgi:hypothetical protein
MEILSSTTDERRNLQTQYTTKMVALQQCHLQRKSSWLIVTLPDVKILL